MLERHPGALVRYRDARRQTADGQCARGRSRRIQGGRLRIGATATVAAPTAAGAVAVRRASRAGRGVRGGGGCAQLHQRRAELDVAQLELHAQIATARAEFDRVGNLGRRAPVAQTEGHHKRRHGGQSANTVSQLSQSMNQRLFESPDPSATVS